MKRRADFAEARDLLVKHRLVEERDDRFVAVGAGNDNDPDASQLVA